MYEQPVTANLDNLRHPAMLQSSRGRRQLQLNHLVNVELGANSPIVIDARHQRAFCRK
jgi:hypothetical protein